MTEQSHYKLDLDKIKTIEDIKNVFELLDLGFYLSEDHKNYKLLKELTIQPEPPKSLEEIQQEFENKIDDLLVKTKRKFASSKEIAKYHYNREFNRIDINFENLKQGRHLSYFTLVSSGEIFTNNAYLVSSGSGPTWSTEYRSGGISVGYWDIKPNLKVHLNKKPNPIVRFFTRLLLDFTWRNNK